MAVRRKKPKPWLGAGSPGREISSEAIAAASILWYDVYVHNSVNSVAAYRHFIVIWAPRQKIMVDTSSEKDASLVVRTLGNCEIFLAGKRLEGLTLRKSVALLLYLVLVPGPHERGRLA